MPQDAFVENRGDDEDVSAGGFPAPPHVLAPDADVLDKLQRWSDPTQTVNICGELLEEVDGEGLLGRIGQSAIRQYDIDQASRSEWLTDSRAAMDLAMQVVKTKTFPWEGASNVIYPILAQAAVQFAARAYPAIVAGLDVVKGVVYGKDDGVPEIDPMTGKPAIGEDGQPLMLVPPGEKRSRADRIAEHMSWQLLQEMTEWEEETDKLLHILPIVGCCFRKVYFDSAERRNVDILVNAEHCVINFWAKSMETAPRITEEMKFYPGEIDEQMRSGIWLTHDFGMAPDAGEDEDAPHDFLEQHRRLDLDDDGYAEPYVVTVHKATGKVVRIVSRYDMDRVMVSGKTGEIAKIEPVHYYTKYDFLPNPKGAIYGVGFGQLLKPLNESVNTALNQIFDAGTLQNTGGGFIGKGLSMHTGSVRRRLGEWTVLNVPGSKIREAIVPLEHGGASDVLFKLLGFLVEAAEKLGSNAEVLSGNQRAANVPATTTLALIEQGLKVFTGVYKRIYRSNSKEFDKLFRLNRLYLDDVAEYQRGEEWREVRRADYEEGSAVQPVSDPSMVSDMQQLARAEFLKEFKDDPYVNPIEARRRIFTAAKLTDVDQLLIKQAQPNPAIELKAEELRIKEIAVRAKALADMTLAVKNLADADKAGAELHLAWIQAEMTALEHEIEALGNGGQGSGQPPGTGGADAAGNRAGGVQPLEAPPGNGALPSLPFG